MKQWKRLMVVTSVGVAISLNISGIVCVARNSNDLKKDFHGESVNDSISNDSVPSAYELAELIVEGDNVFRVEDGFGYVPDKKVKKASYSGISLLEMLNIPTIIIDPSGDGVKTTSGEGIAFFIDYMAASADEVRGIRPEDVKSVEILDFPRNPRFNGAQHVVNFRMVKYLYGGYTKGDATQTVVANTGNYGLRSKMTYKSMTYDLGAGFNYTDDKHAVSSRTTVYNFPDYDLTRYNNPIEGEQKTRKFYVTGRAIYGWNSGQISNTVGFTGNRVPLSYSLSKESFTPANYPSGVSESATRSRNNSVSWSGDYFFMLPNNFSLTANPQFSYLYSHDHYRFSLNNDGIRNVADEDALVASIPINLTKRFGQQSLTFGLGFNYQGNNVKYSGNTASEVKTKRISYSARIDGNFRFGRLSCGGGGYVAINDNDYGGIDNNQMSGSLFIYSSYPISNKIQISGSTELSYMSYGISYLTPHLVINNLVDATKGNPDLRYSRYNVVRLTYYQEISNLLGFSIFGKWNGVGNNVINTFTPTVIDGKEMMLKSFKNNSSFSDTNYGLNLTLSLLNRSLRIQGSIGGENIRRHGENYESKDYLRLTASATYMFRNFYARLAWRNKNGSLSYNNSYDTPEYYLLTLGYGNGNLNLSVTAANVFNSSWRSNTVVTAAGNYYDKSVTCNNRYHRQFSLNVSYSFGYGKKIERGNEVGQQGNVQSAILK